MTDTYNDTTGSRKKFLIPLVVLLLCAVSLTGAGYAYNSTVQDNGSADSEYFVIDLLDDTKQRATAALDADNVLTVYTKTDILTPANNQILGAPITADPLGYVVVYDNNNVPTAEGAVSLTLAVVSGEGWTVNGSVLTKEFNAAATATGTVTCTVTLTINVAAADAEDNNIRAVTVTGALTTGTFTGSPQQAAALVSAAINNLVFSMEFSAVVPGTA